MLKIKLMRFGKKHQPVFRIVVKEARSKMAGTYLELLGSYNPTIKPKVIELNKQKYSSWIKKGAQPTETVKKLALRCKI